MTLGAAIQWALVIGVVVTWILSLWAKKQFEERAWVSLLIFVMATLVAGHVAYRARMRTDRWVDLLALVPIAVLVVQESRRLRRNARKV